MAIIILLIAIVSSFVNILSMYHTHIRGQTRPEFEIIEHNTIFLPDSILYKQCHASTLCKLHDGTLICAWYGGSMEGASDVAIWVSKKEEGKSWTKPSKITDAENIPCWNPVLFYDGDKILLFYKVGQNPENWQSYVKESNDGGVTWTSEKELIAGDYGGRGPVKNKPIQLESGVILAPASVEGDKWSCFVDRSEDQCGTWEKSEYVNADYENFNGKGLIQPALWQDSEGTVHMLMRSSEGVLFKSESKDEGLTWSNAKRTKLPNNNSGIDVACLDDGRLILLYNPVGEVWGARSPIAFSISSDNGETWSEPQNLEYILCDEKINDQNVEFSYPAVIADGCDVYITYTWKKQTIAFWHLRFSDVVERPLH